MTVIPQRELRNNNANVIERVVAGESFVVTRRGQPVARVVPMTGGDPRPAFIPAGAAVSAYPRHPRLDVESWVAESRWVGADDIDDRDAWAGRA